MIAQGCDVRSTPFCQSRSKTTNVSGIEIDATYGHLVPDSEEYLRGLLDTFDSAVAAARDA